jgi:hypothetical protein
MAAARTFRVLPGFNLTLGYTLGYMSLIDPDSAGCGLPEDDRADLG